MPFSGYWVNGIFMGPDSASQKEQRDQQLSSASPKLKTIDINPIQSDVGDAPHAMPDD